MSADLAGLTGQRVIVTAAASGIGRAIAEAFLGAGARVHACDVDEERLAEFRAAFPEVGGTRADVADPQQVDTFFDEALAGLGEHVTEELARRGEGDHVPP